MINLIPEIVKTNFVGKVENVYEIGSRDGNDAVTIAQHFGVYPSNVHIFEPHPDLSAQIKYAYLAVNVHQVACSNVTGKLPFNSCIVEKEVNLGMSSLRNFPKIYDDRYVKIEVDVIRMDEYMKENDVDTVDILKLDVEGCAWEVLDGFGKRIKDVKIIHVECERHQIWDGQKIFSDTIRQLLPTHELVFCYDQGGQSDSIWISRDYATKKA